jgi:large conductance mechanosensitive channel
MLARTWSSEFKQFILRGNVMDLAVGIVIGAAFGAVVTALVKDLLTPLLAAIFGKPDFSRLVFEINGSRFLIGDFLNVVIAFVTIAIALFVFVIKPVNALTSRMRSGRSPDPSTRKCPECLSEIPVAAHRCAFCTVEGPAGEAPEAGTAA